ncbi:MAG: threonine/serine dehydratase, partial [Armatimonadetes bacterium]|nr:threonine/serine dehydratase [Armatimonadota bacterium]
GEPLYLADAVRPTTFAEQPRLSEMLGARVVLACETLQWTGSFKFRAAYNVALSVPNSRILTASSGNFGQAMAYACRILGKSCTVVMPSASSSTKIEAVRSYGGQVDLIDTRECSRAARVAQLARDMPDAYVASAYDDPLVIAGNAGLGREIAGCGVAFEAVIAPIGGGGLASGLWTGMREMGVQTPLYGAEPLEGNDAARSLRAGTIVANAGEPETIADGARTVSLGAHNWAILHDGLTAIVEVPEEAIRQAVRVLFALGNVKAEPTGALAIGAMLADPNRFAGSTVCCVVSGGNVDGALYAALVS